MNIFQYPLVFNINFTRSLKPSFRMRRAPVRISRRLHSPGAICASRRGRGRPARRGAALSTCASARGRPRRHLRRPSPALYSNRRVCPAAVREKGYSCEPGRTCPPVAIVSARARCGAADERSVRCAESRWRLRRGRSGPRPAGDNAGLASAVLGPARPVSARPGVTTGRGRRVLGGGATVSTSVRRRVFVDTLEY